MVAPILGREEKKAQGMGKEVAVKFSQGSQRQYFSWAQWGGNKILPAFLQSCELLWSSIFSIIAFVWYDNELVTDFHV